jgi:hypothetical protein
MKIEKSWPKDREQKDNACRGMTCPNSLKRGRGRKRHGKATAEWVRSNWCYLGATGSCARAAQLLVFLRQLELQLLYLFNELAFSPLEEIVGYVQTF